MVVPLIRLETGGVKQGVKQGLEASQGHIIPFRRPWTFFGAAPPSNRKGASCCCVVVLIRRACPRAGHRYLLRASRLQMKPLRNADWSPLKHQLSPLYCILGFPPSKTPQRQFDLGAGWRGFSVVLPGPYVCVCTRPTNTRSLAGRLIRTKGFKHQAQKRMRCFFHVPDIRAMRIQRHKLALSFSHSLDPHLERTCRYPAGP